MSAKTEKPTPKRLADARKKGQLPRSRLAASMGAVLGGLAALSASAPSSAESLQALTRALLSQAGTGDLTVGVALSRSAAVLFWGSLPVLAGTFAGALAATWLQGGAVLNLTALAFDLNRLNPAKGFGKMFRAENAVNVLRALLIGVGVLLIVYVGLRTHARELAAATSLDALGAFLAVKQVGASTLLRIVGFATAVAGLDLLYERWAWMRRLRMSRDEIKREHKESEGDPHHKAKRKALHRALAAGSPARGVAKATVVVVNPTHVAVALRYAPDECEAPTITAKGSEDKAAEIRQLAGRYGVPIVRDIPLARALLRYDLGEEVPEELYEAAAVVLRQVFELKATSAAT